MMYRHGLTDTVRERALRLGNILYITLLLVNAIAVLNEERFLSRSELPHDIS